jgi:hypothetical protein
VLPSLSESISEVVNYDYRMKQLQMMKHQEGATVSLKEAANQLTEVK